MSFTTASIRSLVPPHSHGTTTFNTAASRQARINYSPLNQEMGQDQPEFAVETFINELNLYSFNALSDEGKRERLDEIDALQLFMCVQEISNELATVKIENHYLTDFLEKNDPKLLIGLRQRRATASIQRRMTNASARSSAQNVRRSSSRRSMMTTTQSIYTVGSQNKKSVDYKLNYKAKTDMADKASADVERSIRQLEIKGMKDIKLLHSRLEEFRFCSAETLETEKNFRRHFLGEQRDLVFLESATEKQLERKFRKFMNNWLKNARALLSTMRLSITTLQENCMAHRASLITKADLSGILGAIDFEQLQIKRTEFQKSLDDKNAHMVGLKGVTGKASLAMSEEKQEMMAIEDKSKKIANKTVDVIKAISKLEKESNYVYEENVKSMKILNQLKEQLDKYDAPSVNEYIEQKDELLSLEKEEKMLLRKISILNMKYNNLQKKCRRRDDSYYME